VDLGCGWGVLSEKMAQTGAEVDALDIAANALEQLRPHAGDRIHLLCDAVPWCNLPDDAYDVVVCTDLIAELPPQDHRLLISELYSVAKPEGHVILSTPLDVNSVGALERFAALVETELETVSWVLSHHAFYLKLRRFLYAPSRYAKAMNDPVYYQKQREKTGLWGRGWLRLNSNRILGTFWKGLSLLLKPLTRAYDQSHWLLMRLESLCRFLKPDDGISHVILLAKLKSLKTTQDVDVQAMSRPVQRLRQRVWE
jgi:SAM-dependent methyltransferase